MGVAVGWAVTCNGTALYQIKKPWSFIDLSLAAGFRAVLPQILSMLGMVGWLIALDLIARAWSPEVWLACGVVSGAALYFALIAVTDLRLIGDFWHAVMSRGS
jgi:hypothetical protein